MHRFFAERVEGELAHLAPEDARHASRVLRLTAGDTVVLFSDGGLWQAELVSVSPEDVVARLTDQLPDTEPRLRITLYQGIPKSDKMELIIQKATELGVTDIVPVESKNCIMKLEPKKETAKIARWQSIAEAAAKQSKRSVIPAVHAPVRFTEAVKKAEEESTVCLIPYEDSRGMHSMCEAIISFLPGSDIAVFIGPEGGYDELEIKYAVDHGIRPVSLGKRILRCETAAIAVLSLIMIRLELAAEMNDGAE